MIVIGGWPGRIVVGLSGRFGVRPAGFASGGDFPNPFVNDTDSGDETTEFVAVVQSLPSSGIVTFDDDGGFSHTGAADGTYATTVRLYTWPQGGPITEHTPDEVITTSFGGAAGAPGALLASAASLIPGGASGAIGASAPGTTLTATSSMIAGSASAAGAGVAPGVTLVASSSLLRGSATGSSPGACDPADIWSYVLPTGLSAADTVSQIHAMLIALTAQAPCPTATQIADAVWAKELP